MPNTAVHIISFDIPYPPIYGGIIDIYFKIKSLSELGYSVILHCFQYRTKDGSDQLEKLCERVYYYPRKKAYQVLFNRMPYIVSSRSNSELLVNLTMDEYPIIFEGLHTCFYLGHPLLKDRNKIVWMHNIEWDYYQNLGKADKNFIHKIHFNVESKKLKLFESTLKSADTIFCVNQQDAEYMKQYCVNSIFVPPFNMNEGVQTKSGKGDYILYHGSLDVLENHQAAVFLIKTIFSNLDKKVIIAGKNPRSSLIHLVKTYPHVELRANLPQNELDELIRNAQCHLLYTFQSTGLKHKLLNALYKGRFVIVNDKMISNSGLEELCILANTNQEIHKAIEQCWGKELSEAELKKRTEFLGKNYSNQSIAKKIIPYIEVNP